MPPLVFPDNTVLCNFASVNRLELLEGWLRGRGRWTAAVAYEVGRSTTVLPALASIGRDGWLGEPIDIEDAQSVARVETIRRVVFGGAPDRPLQHLGEAQTCFLLAEWSEFTGAWWVTDDEDAYEYAVRRGIASYRTVDIMRHLVADDDLRADEAFALMRRMADRDRGLFVPQRSRDLE